MRKVRDFMNRRVIYFSPNNTIGEMVEKFSEYHISGAPIVDGKRVIGIASKSDIESFINRSLHKDAEADVSTSNLVIDFMARIAKSSGGMKEDLERVMSTKISEIMNREVKTVSPDTEINEAGKIMSGGGINRLPVVENDEIVGILARDDLIKGLLAQE